MTFRHDDKAVIHECWVCPAEVRDLLAQCNNLVGAYERGEHDRVATKMADLRNTLDARRSSVDAHFAAIGQPRTVRPLIIPQNVTQPAGMNIGDRVRVFQDRHGRYPMPIPQRPLVGVIVGMNAMDRSCSVLFDHYGTMHVHASDLEPEVKVMHPPRGVGLAVGDAVRWDADEDDGSVYIGTIVEDCDDGTWCFVLRSDGGRYKVPIDTLAKHKIPTGG